MHHRIRCAAPALAGLLTLATAACATAGGTPQIPPHLLQGTSAEFRRTRVAPAQSSLSVIGTDRLVLEPDRPVFDVVARTWPRMFRPEPRSAARLGAPPGDSRGDVIGVYSQGTFIGGQEVLRTMLAREVLAVYRLSLSEEFARYGRAHDGGAVEIIWRPAGG